MFAAVSRRLMLSAVAALSLAGWSRLPAADLAPTDRLLPPNVLLYVSAPSCTEFQERFASTNFGRMVNDPAMADIRAEVMDKFEEASREAESEIGMPLSDLMAIPTGEAAFAVVQPPGEKLGFSLFLDVGDHEDLLDTLLDKAEQSIEDEGQLTRGSEEFEGTEITTYTNENAGPNDPIQGMAYFVKDGMFVLATSVDLLEASLVRWDGDHDRTFADDETFGYILDRCDLPGDDEPVLTWYFNPLGLFKAGMAAAGPQVGMQGAMVMGFLPVLGLDRVKGMGGLMDMATGEYDVVSHSVIYVAQPPTGVLQALVCPPAEQTPPPFISAEIANINGIHWDIQGAYEAVGQVWDFFTAPGTFGKIMDDAAVSPDGPGLHPKDDIIDLLTGQMYMLQDFESGGDLQQQRLAFLFELEDEQAMQDVIGKLTSMDGVDVSIREFRGTKIYEAENPPAGQPMSPALAVANGYLMFAMNVELLESLLRGDDGNSLAKSADFQELRSAFPDKVSTLGFQRQDRVMEALYEMIRQGMEQDDEFNAELLPEFDAIRKYFGVTGSYSIPDEKGVFTASFGFPVE